MGNRYFVVAKDSFIEAIGYGLSGDDITEAEYNNILTAAQNPPTAPPGYAFAIKTDLTWALVELPPEPDEDATPEDYEEALSRLGVET